MPGLDVDDLYRCLKCGQWHPLYLVDPSGSADDVAKRLHFKCPQAEGSFYAGRIGEPARDLTRWRRA